MVIFHLLCGWIVSFMGWPTFWTRRPRYKSCGGPTISSKKVKLATKKMLTVLIYTTYVRYPLSFSYNLKSLAVTVQQLRLHDRLISFVRANKEEKPETETKTGPRAGLDLSIKSWEAQPVTSCLPKCLHLESLGWPCRGDSSQ